MGIYLTKILMETGQEVPDFLAEFKPEGGKLNFDEEEEQEYEEVANGGDAGGGAWESGRGDAAPSAPPISDAWGAMNGTAESAAWPADGDASAVACGGGAW
jgi:ATP-dependent RNA helicase DDX3X